MENESIIQSEDKTKVIKKHRHSKVISGYRTIDDEITWRYSTKNLSPDEDEGIEIRFFLIVDNPSPQKNEAVRKIVKYFEKTKVDWLIPSRKEWFFNLDAMRNEFPELNKLSWCRGKISLEPEFEVEAEKVDITGKRYYETELVFYINPQVLPLNSYMITPPIEIQQSLQRFRLDYPDASKVAFIMMRFGSTKAHDNIVNGIKAALSPHGISAVRADEREYHSDLYYNIMTYLYGCGFGIAVFERIEREDFNPNVSLEVGYLLALNKPVCLLKDRTLATLHTDLVGKLYRTFDPQDPVATIEPEVSKWMRDKGII